MFCLEARNCIHYTFILFTRCIFSFVFFVRLYENKIKYFYLIKIIFNIFVSEMCHYRLIRVVLWLMAMALQSYITGAAPSDSLLWYLGHHASKWTRWHVFNSCMRLCAFHISPISFGKVWRQLFSLSLSLSLTLSIYIYLYIYIYKEVPVV